MTAEIPPMRPRPLVTMADMGMDMSKMDMNGMDSMKGGSMKKGAMEKSSMDHMKMDHGSSNHKGAHKAAAVIPVQEAKDIGGPGVAMRAADPRNRLSEPGFGLRHVDHKVLVYSDLRSLDPLPDQRPPGRELVIHLTGNMERYMWSFDGKKYWEVKKPIPFRFGERLRLTLVNDTMMNHPIHLHGMFMDMDTGAGIHNPRKHTINVLPGSRVSADISAIAEGDWAFHCHFLYHMMAGMFRVVRVSSDMGLQS